MAHPVVSEIFFHFLRLNAPFLLKKSRKPQNIGILMGGIWGALWGAFVLKRWGIMGGILHHLLTGKRKSGIQTPHECPTECPTECPPRNP